MTLTLGNQGITISVLTLGNKGIIVSVQTLITQGISVSILTLILGNQGITVSVLALTLSNQGIKEPSPDRVLSTCEDCVLSICVLSIWSPNHEASIGCVDK